MDYPSWYSRLKKPSWAPPELRFGQVWSFLYPIIFGVNIYVIYLLTTGKISWKVALPFWINLALNFLFTPLQFGLRNQILSSIDIVLVLVTIVWCMVAIWPHNKWVALLFVPYFIWVAIASVLQINITLLNI
jgi:tryptophan-rich sensory protein